MFRPKVPRAGSVRIGEPPSPEEKRRSVGKIDHFQFCLPTRLAGEKFYRQDPAMHAVYGEKPTSFGPVYFISDNVLESLQISLAWWASGKSGASRRMCFRIFNSLMDDVNGDPVASRFDKASMDYKDHPCLGQDCPDFVRKACNKGVLYRFLMPKGTTLGEYFLSAKSYAAINAALGFVKMLQRMLPMDFERGELIGLSKIPVYFDLHHLTMPFKDPRTGRLLSTQVFYPVPIVRSESGGAYESLVRIAEQEKRALRGQTQRLGRSAQYQIAAESTLKDVQDEDEVVILDAEEVMEEEAPTRAALPETTAQQRREMQEAAAAAAKTAREARIAGASMAMEAKKKAAEAEVVERARALALQAEEDVVFAEEEPEGAQETDEGDPSDGLDEVLEEEPAVEVEPFVEDVPRRRPEPAPEKHPPIEEPPPRPEAKEESPEKEKKELEQSKWLVVQSLGNGPNQEIAVHTEGGEELPDGFQLRAGVGICATKSNTVVLPAEDQATQVIEAFKNTKWPFAKLRQNLSVYGIERTLEKLRKITSTM